MNRSQQVMKSPNSDDHNAVKSALILQFRKLMAALDLDQYPASAECDKAKQLILQYIAIKSNLGEIDNKGLSESIRVTYEDINVIGIRARDVIKDIAGDPVYIATLHSLALKKILPIDYCDSPKDKLEFLIKNGYIVQVCLKVGKDHEVVCYSLSSKGWLCFMRKGIIEQLNKRLGTKMLYVPADLCSSVSNWNNEDYLKALILNKYYHRIQTQNEYLIFTFPEARDLLIGCVPDETESIEYVFPVLNRRLLSDESLHAIELIANTESISKLTVLLPSLEAKQAVEQALANRKSVERKVGYYIMENKDE